MNVVHVSAYFAPAWGFGGPPRSLFALCEAQQAAGLDVEVFTTTANTGDELAPAPDGLLVDGVRVRRFPLTSPRSMFGAPSMTAALTAAAHAADIVHVHGLFNRTVWLAADIARRSRAPLIVSPRGMLNKAALSHHAWRKRAAWTLFDRRVVDAAQRLHASSVEECDTLGRIAGPDKVTYIPHGVALAPRDRDAQALRAWCGLPADAPYVLFLGRLHRIKRLDLLADAFSSLATAHPDLHLVIAGPEEQRLRPAIEARLAPCATRVRWTGPVEGGLKTALLAEALTLVLCSDAESFGLVAAEALAAGIPPIVTRTCPWSVLEQERCGRWVEPTAPAIAAAIAEYLDDPPARAERAARARDVARVRFAWPTVARRFAGLYEDVRRERRLSVA
jgi:glycosyltransferase involved in cell wall biosynthesis